MSKENNDFGYLGKDYQYKLIKQILSDVKFANIILPILEVNYFDDTYLKLIILELKEAHDNKGLLLDKESLLARLLSKVSDVKEREFVKSTLNNVEEASLNDGENTKEIGKKFCLQKRLEKANNKVKRIIEKGDLNSYDECVDIIKNAIEYGLDNDDGEDVFADVDSVLADDYRDPISTGINTLDKYMDGGLSRGELGLVIAPLGVGKTTLATKLANAGKNEGKNVLQIFFEDTPKIIRRKHFACWSGIKLNDLKNNRDFVKEIVAKNEELPGKITLKRFPSDSTTFTDIKNYVKRMVISGNKPDLILLDYIDCVSPSKNFDDINVSEGHTMREFETFLYEYDIAGWAFTQGNRSSIKAEVVEADQIAGSIKKAQIGHFIMTIAKTLPQKDSNRANVAIVKSRIGDDGVVFEDVVFDNGRVHIDITEDHNGMSFMEQKENKEERKQQRLNQLIETLDKRKEKVN